MSKTGYSKPNLDKRITFRTTQPASDELDQVLGEYVQKFHMKHGYKDWDSPDRGDIIRMGIAQVVASMREAIEKGKPMEQPRETDAYRGAFV